MTTKTTKTDRTAVRRKLADYLRSHPQETFAVISRKLNCSICLLSRVAAEYGCGRGRKPLSEEQLKNLENSEAQR